MSTRKSFDIEAMRAIGRRIREARGEETQTEFAKAIKVDRATLSNYETGRRLPNAETIELIEYITGIGSGYVLSGKRDSFNIVEDAMKKYQSEFIKQSQRNPGFYPKWFFSDFEIALLRCFRDIGNEDRIRITSDIIKIVENGKKRLNDAAAEEMPTFSDESLQILKEALQGGPLPIGLDVEQVLWALVGRIPFFGNDPPEGAQ